MNFFLKFNSLVYILQVTHAREALPPPLEASIHAIVCILSYDGLSGISFPSEPVDSITFMIQATEIDKSMGGRSRDSPNNFLRSLMNHNTHQNSALHNHKDRESFRGSRKGNETSSSYDGRPAVQGSTIVGSGSGMYVTHGPRGDSFKRQRGSGSKVH